MCGDRKIVKEIVFDSKYICTYILEDLVFVKKNVKKSYYGLCFFYNIKFGYFKLLCRG